MSNTGASFRRASKDDADSIFRVLSSAFQLEDGSSKWQSMRGLAYGATESFLVVERIGEVIGTAMISSHWLRVGIAKVLKGDVGEVAVLRELHGQGFGTYLMQESVRYLRENGFHLSRLGGLKRFYAKFGYIPFPRRFYEFLLIDAKAGASSFPPDYIVKPTPEQEQRVRLYHPRHDWQRRNELYDSFNENRTGSLIEGRGGNPPSGEPDPRALRFVYDDGKAKGYLFASEYSYEPSPFEAKVTIYDVAFDMDSPEAFVALMRCTLRESLRRGAQRVTARLPFDPIVQKLLTDDSLPFSLHDLQSGLASNMIQVIDLKVTLESIESELTRRRTDTISYPTFSTQVQLNEQKAMMIINPESVQIESGDMRADAHIACDAASFLRWILGLNSFDEWQEGVTNTLNRHQKIIFSSLFRKEPCASGPWG